MANYCECPNACQAVCSCGWKSEPYLFNDEGGEDCAQVSLVIETRLGHLIANGNGGKCEGHQVSYRKVTVEGAKKVDLQE